MFGLQRSRDTREHAGSWYAATANDGGGYPALEDDISTEIVVVGAGFTGTNLALELAERGHEVVLLEANRLGWGASSLSPTARSLRFS